MSEPEKHEPDNNAVPPPMGGVEMAPEVDVAAMREALLFDDQISDPSAGEDVLPEYLEPEPEHEPAPDIEDEVSADDTAN